MNRCQTCHRTLIPKAEWFAMTRAERKHVGRTHARAGGVDVCERDRIAAQRRGAAYSPEFAYTGGWVVVRGIRRPVEVQRRAS